MTKWPQGYFEVDGQWWYSGSGRDRRRSKRITCQECGKEANACPGNAGTHCSKSCGARKPRRTLTPDNLFEQWTAEMAWLAGLIWADGGLIVDQYKGRAGHAHVKLTSTDEEIAVAAASIAGGIKYQTCIPPVRAHRRKPTHSIKIGNRKSVTRLIEAGLTPAKSHTCELPRIPRAAMPSFLRGYFDGDGSVGIYRNKNVKDPKHEGRLVSSFVGSRPMLEEMQNLLSEELGFRHRKLRHTATIFCVQYNHHASLDLASYLYQDSGPFLRRKAAIFSRGFHLPRQSNYRPVLPWPDVLKT